VPELWTLGNKDMKTILTLLFIFSMVSTMPAQQKLQPPSVEERLAAQDKEIAWLRSRVIDLEKELETLRESPEIKIPAQVRNNLRILDAALQQYCLDHKVTECRFSDLVGEGKYVDAPRQKIADGERYDGLRLALDESEWRVTTRSGFTIVFVRPPFDKASWDRMTKK
jgi:cell division protein FtsB